METPATLFLIAACVVSLPVIIYGDEDFEP